MKCLKLYDIYITIYLENTCALFKFEIKQVTRFDIHNLLTYFFSYNILKYNKLLKRIKENLNVYLLIYAIVNDKASKRHKTYFLVDVKRMATSHLLLTVHIE